MSLTAADENLRIALASLRVGDHEKAAPHTDAAARNLRVYRASLGKPKAATNLLDLSWDRLSLEAQFEQLLTLRHATLTAEIGDYRNDARMVDAVLAPIFDVRDDVLRKSVRPMKRFNSDKEMEWRLLRQELFCAHQISVRLYRLRQMELAAQTIAAAIQIAEIMDPISDGLLTQLYYGQAKVMLRNRDFLQATVLFRKSLAKASKRFAHAMNDDMEREAAQYSVGKASALGLGQALLDQGRMEEAHGMAVAGHMLLELTTDHVHRNFARQLLGSIQRKSTRDSDTELLGEAAEHLEESLKFFAARKHAAAFRSRYELALIALHRRELDAAEQAMRQLLADAEKAKLQKWIASAHIGLSRIARKSGQYDVAVAEAKSARAIATRHQMKTMEIKAHTALVQSRFEQNAASPDALRAVELDVLDLLSGVPEHDVRSRVVALLVLVRVLAARKNLRQARARYEEYERIAQFVQSPRINDLAAEALKAISPTVEGFRCPADEMPPKYEMERNVEALERYVVLKVNDDDFKTESERAEALRVPPSTYYRKYRPLLATSPRSNQRKKQAQKARQSPIKASRRRR